MNNKGALEISVNAIVILIVALAVLGLIIGFAVSQFNELSGQLTVSEETPTPSAQNPVTLPAGKSEFTLNKNSQLLMEAKVYNSGDEIATLELDVACAGFTTSGTANPTITAESPVNIIPGNGQITTVPISFEETNVAPGRYACNLEFADGQTTPFTKTIYFNVQ